METFQAKNKAFARGVLESDVNPEKALKKKKILGHHKASLIFKFINAAFADLGRKIY